MNDTISNFLTYFAIWYGSLLYLSRFYVFIICLLMTACALYGFLGTYSVTFFNHCLPPSSTIGNLIIPDFCHSPLLEVPNASLPFLNLSHVNHTTLCIPTSGGWPPMVVVVGALSNCPINLSSTTWISSLKLIVVIVGNIAFWGYSSLPYSFYALYPNFLASP